MTMPIIAPQLPTLDTANPWQMMEYFGRWLFALDPDAVTECWQILADQAIDWTQTFLEEGMASLGMKRGDPEQRMAAYVRKARWATEIDPATGQLLHPVMTQAPVYDPKTMMPVVDPITGQTQMQDVPTGKGEDLWQMQLHLFPRQFLIDATDAYEMGAPLPQWAVALVEETKVHEGTSEGKKALRSAVQVYKPKKMALVAA